MRSRTVVRSLLASVAGLALLAPSASADLIRYTWSGTVEPAAGQPNPWNLAGDGSAVTKGDGSPFLVQALVDEAAEDLDALLNPDLARFDALATLTIGFEPTRLTAPRVTFHDDDFSGLFDSVGFSAEVERLGTTLSFVADVRLPATSFDLASPAAPDPPPLFPQSHPIQFGGSVVSILVTLPSDTPVTAERVPWAAFPAATPVEWSGGTAGVAGEIEASVSGLDGPAPTVVDLSLPDYAAAPSYALAPGLAYATGSTWTVTFSEPVATLLLHPRFWRGSGGGADPVEYHFDVPFAIRSGLAEATVLGDSGGLVLSLPSSGFHDGVVQIPGPLTSLTVTPNTTTAAQQIFSMAVVPMPTARAVDWTTPTSGTVAGIDVTLADLGSPTIGTNDLSGADFAVRPLSASQELLEFVVGSDWTASFSEPIPGLLLYAKEWRGANAGVAPVTYRFDRPFVIVSGLEGATVSEDGTLLTLPGDGFHDGILSFPGPLETLAVGGDATAAASFQGMTFAVVPEPGAAAAGLASIATLFALRPGLRRRARACAGAAPRSSASGSAGSARTPS